MGGRNSASGLSAVAVLSGFGMGREYTRRGFMEDYTKWIWPGEGIHTTKIETSSKIYESYGDSMPRYEEDDAENDRVEEMIQDA
ncbi:hypothetical protein AgCh_014814 [Apium graveolens]